MTPTDMHDAVMDCHYPGWQIVFRPDKPIQGRYYIQVRDDAGVCNHTGEAMPWGGRKWFLSSFMTRSEIVQTCFAAVKMALEHEAREKFTYRGETIFGPHIDVDRMWAVVQQRANLSVREEEALEPSHVPA